jgi:hypothetical protein
MTAAPAQSDIAAIARDVHQAQLALHDAELREKKLEKNVDSAREITARRRLELGKQLVRARAFWPARGPKAKGWGEFLVKLGIEERTARNYMQLAGYVDEVSETDGDVSEIPTYADAGMDKRPRLSIVRDQESDPPPADHVDDVVDPGDAADADVSVPDISAIEVPAISQIDRNTWCTPKPLAEKLGKFDLDPCSNDRSHIKSKFSYRLERGEDGLVLAREVPKNYRVFINPPYARGLVLKWILAYAHTRFCFLVKFDPSTDWFAELAKRTKIVCFPKGDRVEFEAPPGVPPDMQNANPFPHGLFYANPDDVTSAIKRSCFMWKPL